MAVQDLNFQEDGLAQVPHYGILILTVWLPVRILCKGKVVYGQLPRGYKGSQALQQQLLSEATDLMLPSHSAHSQPYLGSLEELRRGNLDSLKKEEEKGCLLV